MKKAVDKRRYMDSLSEVLFSLKQKDQDAEFFLPSKDCLTLRGRVYRPAEVKIIRTYRFEGESDPGDQAIIYIVKANDGRMGFCIDGYGMSTCHTDDLYHDFIKHAAVESHNKIQ